MKELFRNRKYGLSTSDFLLTVIKKSEDISVLHQITFELSNDGENMRTKFARDDPNAYRCCLCCHVRTGTVFLGILNLVSDVK